MFVYWLLKCLLFMSVTIQEQLEEESTHMHAHTHNHTRVYSLFLTSVLSTSVTLTLLYVFFGEKRSTLLTSCREIQRSHKEKEKKKMHKQIHRY